MSIAFIAACSTPPDPTEQPDRQDPTDSTPATDATVGVDEDLVDFYTQQLDWSSCGEFECATLDVPLDYEDPAGETIDLAVLRVRAEGDDPTGSLIVNPGGPGASGLDYARAARAIVSDAVRQNYDIVGFDPRGVGSSAPVECLDDEQLDAYLDVDGTPDDEQEVTDLQESIETYVTGCQNISGEILPHVGTENVARDVDILRAALGDSSLTYLGASYGTYIGAKYAELFPDRAGRLVLDGAIDPTLTAEEYAKGQAAGFEQAVSEFIEWCVGEECSLGSDADSIHQALIDLLDEADEEPLATSEEDRPLTETLAFYGLILPFYQGAQAYETALGALEQAIHEDDGDGLLTLADLYLQRNSDGTYANNSFDVFNAVTCLDHPESNTPDDVESAMPEFEEASPILGRSLAWGGLTCSSWPVESDTMPAPITAEGADPILVIGTTGDPATPYEWAQSLADQLSSGVLVTRKGTGHTGYRSGNTCVDEAVDAYLLTGNAPGDDLVCSS